MQPFWGARGLIYGWLKIQDMSRLYTKKCNPRSTGSLCHLKVFCSILTTAPLSVNTSGFINVVYNHHLSILCWPGYSLGCRRLSWKWDTFKLLGSSRYGFPLLNYCNRQWRCSCWTLILMYYCKLLFLVCHCNVW